MFGPETVNHIDGATVEFGIVHAPETKGSLIYTDRAKEKAEGGLGLGTTFVVPLQSHRELGAPLTLVDDDFVEGIRMEEASHRLLEK